MCETAPTLFHGIVRRSFAFQIPENMQNVKKGLTESGENVILDKQRF